MRKHTTTLAILATIAGLSFGSLALAQHRPLLRQGGPIPPEARVVGGTDSLGMSYFVGPPSGDPYQLITGYDAGLVYTAGGESIAVGSESIVLGRAGTYRIHLEAAIFFDSDDPTADENAAGLFTIVLNGIDWIQCVTSGNTSTAPLPAAWRPTGDHDVAATCTVDFTIQVKGAGSPPGEFPLVFPRDTEVQTALVPNDRALGDSALVNIRWEIARLR